MFVEDVHLSSQDNKQQHVLPNVPLCSSNVPMNLRTQTQRTCLVFALAGIGFRFEMQGRRDADCDGACKVLGGRVEHSVYARI